MYSLIIKNNYEGLFPYVEIALRIFSSCPIDNYSTERGFSILKMITFYLRSKTTDKRLHFLVILTIESYLTNILDYDDIIDTFLRKKLTVKMINFLCSNLITMHFF